MWVIEVRYFCFFWEVLKSWFLGLLVYIQYTIYTVYIPNFATFLVLKV